MVTTHHACCVVHHVLLALRVYYGVAYGGPTWSDPVVLGLWYNYIVSPLVSTGRDRHLTPVSSLGILSEYFQFEVSKLTEEVILLAPPES